ncbi:uncharacterized protein N7515_009235 [Penicillium bovifimosum]|uniref:Uncharacterized protein n=1 Tax=Penicillium bovifimosum TaxID=126998 RepID=A0A9W9GK14_9EURO|nr:uncharacterized protein N7515_009235 [Penicillium bovifimosum]KAJ5121274.1 hypothetical protein N7515_009235 [Penicillium bovifimosum]
MAVIGLVYPAIPATTTRRSIIKRGNWADKNRGVVLVFCIVFLVVVGIMALFGYRKFLKRKAEKESYETSSA